MMQSNSNVSSSSSSSPADTKIQTDLTTLSDQIELCQSMLGSTSPSSRSTNEALLAVIGFLEACVPRMVELVDAAAQGALHESTLERCLEVNDALLKTLQNFDDPEYRGGGGTAKAPPTTASAAASAAAPSGEAEGLAGDLDDLLLDTTPVKGGKSTGEEVKAAAAPKDPFGETDLLGVNASVEGGKKDAGEDDFDAFLKERTS